MKSDQSMIQIIRSEVIKSGQSMFYKYLNDTFTKKNEKKRKPKEELLFKKPDYSVINLIKIEIQKLSSNQLIAQELIKFNFTIKQSQDEINDEKKYYEDFETAQRINQKVIKRFLKPVKKNISSTRADSISKSSFQMFKTRSESLLGKQAEIQLNNLDLKIRPKPKLQTKRQMLEKIDEQLIYFISDVKIHFRQLKFQEKLKKINFESIEKMCLQFKELFASEGISNSAYKIQKALQKFLSLVQERLPSYVRREQYQSYSPLPWKTNQLQKEHVRTSFQQITGKVLYKYEHNMGEIKQKALKLKMHQFQKEGFKEIQKYLIEKETEKIQIRKEKLDREESKSWKDRNQKENKQKVYFSQSLVSNHLELQKRASKHQEENVLDQSLTNPTKSYHPNSKPPNYNAFDSNKIQNFINFRTSVPASSKIVNYQELDLDQNKFLKHDHDLHSEKFFFENGKRKPKQTLRNIVFAENVQSPPQKQFLDTQQCKIPVKVEICQLDSYDYSESQSSNSEESKFFNSMTQYKQKKTTKKKKSFLKKTPPQSRSIGQIKIKENLNFVLNKKRGSISFYPLKIGNLILERKNYAYIEYNSAKEELKNLTVKFLIDRLKHGVNNVEIIVPSFGFHNLNTMKVNDQQKAKQMIKIILSLGGNVQKIKAKSGYDEKTSENEQRNRPNISNEIQIYKFFYKDLSYFEIIDTLNLERQWMESERDNRKLDGWKY